MNILIVAGSKTEFSLGKLYSRAFQELGHNVVEYYDMDTLNSHGNIFDYDLIQKVNWWRFQLKTSYSWFKKILIIFLKPLLIYADTKTNKELLDLALTFNPDIFFTIPARAINAETICSIMDKTNCLAITYHGDSYDNFYSTSRNMLESLPLYDIVFSFSMSFKKNISKLGAKKVEYLPFAFDPFIHNKIPVGGDESITYLYDVVFVGCWDKGREKTLSLLCKFKLGIWGPGWDRVSPLSGLNNNIVKSSIIGAQEMSNIYSKSRLCLNPLRDQNTNSHNMKTFEIPAMGGVMLTNKTVDHLNLFIDEKEIIYYRNNDDIIAVVNKYIKNDCQLKQISDRSHNKVIKNHRYIDRVRYIIKKLKNE
jgi:spore maturation protein CgeB